jgi:DNA polymerase I-like protein with 3'-5' exonuclease and polymerase domains
LLDHCPDAQWLGHNFCGAEAGILESLGIKLRPEQIQDTILWHYLLNMHLCKSSKKVEDEDEKRGRGFMNLYVMCALYTDCDNWKACIGEEQCLHEGRSCPEHNPFQYNGEDTYWPLVAFAKMLQIARMRKVDKLYPLHRDLSLVLQKVKRRGVLVDVPYVDKLRADFEHARKELEAGFSFNPNSSQQVMKHFGLENAQEATVREAAEAAGEESELGRLLEYKELGKGPDRWFAPRRFNYEENEWEGYVDDSGYIHCSLGIFTSTGRFNCTNPNLQNVAKRRKDRRTGESLGKRVRRAIVAPDGHLLYRADYKAAEYRTFLTLAGYRDIPEDMDFHTWMAKVMSIAADDPFAMSLGGPRDAAKSVMFGTIYLEGVKLVKPRELNSPKLMNEVAKGARLVFPEWKVFGKVVTFTGINLARRALGGATLQNRAIALGYVQRIFKEFPKARDLQIRLTQAVERDRAVITPTGYCCLSYGWEEDRLKTAAAMHGSNPVAQFIKYAMIRADSHPMLNQANVLSIHDENLFYVDARHEPEKVKGWIEEVMVFNLPEIPPLKIPIDCSVGKNWADQREIDGY